MAEQNQVDGGESTMAVGKCPVCGSKFPVNVPDTGLVQQAGRIHSKASFGGTWSEATPAQKRKYFYMRVKCDRCEQLRAAPWFKKQLAEKGWDVL